jgi:hypothetical protein
MSNSGYREEVFNVLLAQLLAEQGIVSAPEQSIKQALKSRSVPDVMVIFRGLRTAIEGKVDDNPKAKDEVMQNIQHRIEQGIAHIGIAVLYPAYLRKMEFNLVKGELNKIKLQIAIYSEAGEQGWTDGDINYLGDMLRRTFDQLVKEDVVAQAVAALEAGVEVFAHAMSVAPAAIERSAELLGISEPPAQGTSDSEVSEE